MLSSKEVRLYGKRYVLELHENDRYVLPRFQLAYCDELASDFKPIILDNDEGDGSKPFPPSAGFYRLLLDLDTRKMSLLFEIYWPEQDCDWRNINKDHKHDYEPILICFDLELGSIEKVILGSTGSIASLGHGVDVYTTDTTRPEQKELSFRTSAKPYFPWGGTNGQEGNVEARIIPFGRLVLKDMKQPMVLIVTCYHVFTGLPPSHEEDKESLKSKILPFDVKRLDSEVLLKWYRKHIENNYGRDVSKILLSPYLIYYPPPKQYIIRFFYRIFYHFYLIRKLFIKL